WYWIPFLIIAPGLGALLLWFYRRQQQGQQARTRQLREELLRDLHDEMGSKLAVVNMYGALLQDQLSPGDLEKTGPILNKLLGASTDLYQSMQDLQWMLDPEKDQLRHLLYELKAFGQELLSPTGAVFQETIELSPDLLGQKLPIHYKKNVLFLFKEAIHNTAKHAGATEAGLQVWSTVDHIHICWWDKGGAKPPLAIQGNGYGLKSMQARAEKIGAALKFGHDSGGTQVRLRWPVGILLREEKSVS
ncbi:MAG: hypothetical protein KDC44_23370, partial [Phaeodactylibacter sp.]|nr:hypothetical protein [Phaeodactylibacter sp.]